MATGFKMLGLIAVEAERLELESSLIGVLTNPVVPTGWVRPRLAFLLPTTIDMVNGEEDVPID